MYTVAFNYSGDANYAPYSGSTTLTVTPAPLTVNVTNVSALMAHRTRPSPAPSPARSPATPSPRPLLHRRHRQLCRVGTPVNDKYAQRPRQLQRTQYHRHPGTITITQATVAVTVTANACQPHLWRRKPILHQHHYRRAQWRNLHRHSTYCSGHRPATSPVGTYPSSRPSLAQTAGNYNVTSTNGSLIVTPGYADSVTANNTARPMARLPRLYKHYGACSTATPLPPRSVRRPSQ